MSSCHKPVYSQVHLISRSCQFDKYFTSLALIKQVASNNSSKVKQVSWLKSSLLLRIKTNTHTNYNSWLKLGIASLIGKYIQQMKEGDQAWLGLDILYLN